MKKIFALLLSLALLASLCACTKDNTPNTENNSLSHGTINTDTPADNSTDSITDSENIVPTSSSEETNGVPESVVLRNVSIGENVTYDIIHHYDAASHIDDVELTTYYSGEYGTRTTTYTYAYQYNRSTDLWTLISGNNGMQSDVVTLSEEYYENNSYFEGTFKQAHSGTYTIKVKNLDLSNKQVTVDYVIMFDDNSPALISHETFDLYTTSDGENFCFVIPYKRSMVVKFELVFALDIDMGIIA